jgi:UPF0755 protein
MKFTAKQLFSRSESYLILSFFIAVLFVLVYIFFTPNYYTAKSPIQFDIKKGEPFSDVVERLYNNKIIPSKTNFRIAAFLYGAETRIRAARYYIPNGLSYMSLLDLFISGKCNFARKITIRDGQTIRWLASKLRWQVHIDSADFVNKAYDTAFVHSLGLQENSLQGYLFSKDYQIYEYSSPEEALKKFYNAFKNFYNDSLKNRTHEIGFTTNEVITLASIIKGETNDEEEMPRISGVYHNRLRIGMKLQADPTIQYLFPDGWRRVLYEDLEIDSPYNTYKYAGLPPGPINNPGKAAILAALYPEKNSYLYFVANGNGGHNFGKRLSDHLRNVREYRKWLKKQNKN